MAEINPALRFETGIDSITQHSGAEDARLPDTSTPLPGEASYEHKLDEVLYPPSLEQSLINSMRPDINQRTVLSPVKYQAMIESTQKGLDDEVNGLESPEAREQLQDTIQLLEEEKDLRDLLNTYRHVLHRA